MRKVAAVIICIAIFLITAGCGAGAGAPVQATAVQTVTPEPTPVRPEVTLDIASSADYKGMPLGNAIKEGINDLKTQSGGLMAVTYEGGKDAESAVLESVISGGVSIYLGDVQRVSAKIPQLNVCEIPMLFSDAASCNKTLSGSFADMMQPYFNSAGLELLGAYCTSMSNLTSNKMINSAADIKSLKIRTEVSAYDTLFWKTAGCFPAQLEWPNVYISLKQKMLEAQESTDENINSHNLYEVQGYIIKTNHLPEIRIFAMNRAQYNALTEDQQKWLAGFISGVEQKAEEGQAAFDSQLETMFTQKGMKVTEASSGLITALTASVQPVTELVKTTVDPALVDAYIAACK